MYGPFMLIKIQTKKNVLSTWTVAAFLSVLVFAAFISEFFQTPNNTSPEISRYQKLFGAQQLNSIKAITLKNNLGTFQLKRTKEDPDTPWHLTSPRHMPADKKRVINILSVLRNIKIRKVFQKDKINIQNFSLDEPLLELSITDSGGLESTLHLGLINPIDNSTYAMLSTHEAIYHIDSLDFSLGNLDYSHFIDSRIFTFDPLQITNLKIFRGKKGSNNLALQFQKKGDDWAGKNGHALDHEKVQNLIQKIVEIRSLFIIDKSDEKMEKQLEKFIGRPLFTIEVKDQNNRFYQYIVSGLINALPGLRLEKWQNFAITASNRKFPYVLNREMLKNFSKPEKTFRVLPFKKLFY